MYKRNYTQHILLTNSTISTCVTKLITHEDTPRLKACFYAGLKPVRQQQGGAI